MGKAPILLILLIFICVPGSADTITVPAPVYTPVFSANSDGEHINIADFSTIASPGNPALPFKDIRIILPPSANPKFISVDLAGSSATDLNLSSDMAPAPPILTIVDGKTIQDWGSGNQIESGRNVSIYNKSALFPASNVELLDIGRMRKWRIATIRYYPFRYNPVTRELESSSGGSIEISYRPGIASATVSSASRDNVLDIDVKSICSNYAQAQAWYSASKTSTTNSLDEPSTLPGYAIVTTSAIATASTKLQNFIAHKSARGFNVQLVTEAQWGGGTGDAAADNIRAWLQANYVAQSIKYVLLIGNPNPASGDVPMKMLWPRSSSDTYREAPSDYYYADLTGNWDINGNGYYGEQNGDFDSGGIDRYPEVFVGRIPYYGDIAQLDSILRKIINYESGAFCGAWVHNVLLSMKPSDSSTPGYQLGEAINSSAVAPAGFHSTRVYDGTYGLTPVPDYTSCNYDNVLTAWRQHAGFHFWWTHGNETIAADVFTPGNCQYLDDNYPSFTFQCSCSNASPEIVGNLAYSLLKQGAIATDAATRVSWYYPGEINYTNSDSNAGMAYKYALKLIRDHLPCGDAHYAMMLEVPNNIWMNHCVFNLYGDPSVAYPFAPIIVHTPLSRTDIDDAPYAVNADITTSSPMVPGSPVVKWNTDGGQAFNDVQMNLLSGSTYRAYIPAQSYGTTVYYYISATDAASQSAVYPQEAPQSLLSFQVMEDSQPPTITHTPLTDTGNRFGPYPVMATVTDDLGVQAVSLHYNINGGPYADLPMLPVGSGSYEADIPGPTSSGDIVGYYITAVDSSIYAHTSRLPIGTDEFSFKIAKKICVAILNSTSNPPYFTGGNMNAYQPVADVLNADPNRRFQVTVLTSLDPGTTSSGLEGQDALVLPDNAVPVGSLQSVSDWFTPGKVILTLDSATCYAAYSGWMWPTSVGSHGYGAYWDYDAGSSDQQVWASDPVTSGYSVGQLIGSTQYDAQFFADQLPSDAHILTGKSGDPTRCYAAYRDVPGKGRFVIFGPYIPVSPSLYSMVREALVPPPSPRQISILSPNGGESFNAGESVRITLQTSGTWDDTDRVQIQYYTGLDTLWRQVPGVESLPYDARPFQWNTTGLPGSHNYKLRVIVVGDSISDESDQPFSIIPTVTIEAAKFIPDGQIVQFAGKVVTCAIPGLSYIEEPDRRAGIKLGSVQNLEPSALVNATGTLSTVDGERILDVEELYPLGTGARIIPLAMRTGFLGGGSLGLQQAVMESKSDGQTSWSVPAAGLNNVGLLVRCFGRVTSVGQNYFYIDDGTKCDDGSGAIGVRVICSGVSLPAEGQYVLLNAISSTYFDRGNLYRALVLPDKDCLQLFIDPNPAQK